MEFNKNTTSKVENPVSLQSVREFVSHNIIPARDGRKCVDGRYELATEDSGMIARPGGDFGYVEVLLALNDEHQLGLTPEQCFDKVFDAVTADGGRFFMHTDEHADPDKEEEHTMEKPLIGCGHIAKAANPDLAAMYKVDPETVKQAVEYARKKAEQDSKMRITNLKGNHQEKGVLINQGTNKTVNPFNRDQYFLYDVNRDNEFIQKLVPQLHIGAVTVEEFMRVSNDQLEATLYNLALGKEKFIFNADSDTVDVSSAGTVT